ncbi:sphingomyelin phosphodiesterase 5-like isoform X2 [Physella acuta]|nr:sphingomyelin phosphodiesterase 5-like isoform X2 [Physella acuta]XP_059176108.1 sphingomyelin phosphodiesterase 5-like isoform X2 [Physella acuta]XP_059176109.1 sphingomyelin phosphodiesterase 5-like isoform X2 [Physella acuta]
MAVENDSGVSYLCLKIARTFLYPSFLAFNLLMSLYITTFEEEKYPNTIFIKKVLLTPVYGALFILFLPLLIIFLPVRCGILYFRKNHFMVSVKHTTLTESQRLFQNDLIRSGKYKFGIATANLCLMPELASKMNHLINVNYRARKIGEKILANQFFNDEWNSKEMEWKISKNKSQTFTTSNSGDHDRGIELEGNVCTNFPRVDIMAIQEAWSSYHNKTLMKELHKVFPYIVHDAGVHSYSNNAFFLNSGLLIASKHPILAIDFKPFSHFVKHGRVLSNGLLMVKVALGDQKNSGSYVGYVFNTHLQSYQGKDQIIPKQLDEIRAWISQFTERNRRDGDNILFSIICGDFNFDTFSPADKESTQHPIFSEFVDFCRVRAGLDKPWTVGTEMRPEFMLDSPVTTQEGLKKVLEDPVLRQCHIVDADIIEHSKEVIVSGSVKKDEHGNVKLFPEGGRRRIDYILYNKSYPLKVESYSFVTKLAGLTDHIPVAMEFMCEGLK